VSSVRLLLIGSADLREQPPGFRFDVRAHQPRLEAALSSFGRIDMHEGLDWQAWQSHEFEFQPQAYFCDNEARTPKACIDAAARVWPTHAIHPTIGA
jgi:hypothetical protein